MMLYKNTLELRNYSIRFVLLITLAFSYGCTHPTIQVGPEGVGQRVSTSQLVRPAGETVEFGGRPVDMVLPPDGRFAYLKDNRGIVVLDTSAWRVIQELPFDGHGASMHGMAITRDGKRLFVTTAQDRMYEARIQDDGRVSWERQIFLPGPKGEGASHNTGVALSLDERTAYVCLSRNNSLAIIDLTSGNVLQEIPVGVAPYDVVLTEDGSKAYVSNWGGRHPREGERSEPSSGTEVLVDERGIAASGTVSLLDLEKLSEVMQASVGLHPSDLVLSPDGERLYVANANSDTVSVIHTGMFSVQETIRVRPDENLPFGSAPNALALSDDGETLYVANGGNNAVAVVQVARRENEFSQVRGFIPTSWYPGSLALSDDVLYVANVKGNGSRSKDERKDGWHVYWHQGTVNKIFLPNENALRRYTAQVMEDTNVPQILRAWEQRQSRVAPRPVPQRLGEPSVFDHVVYIIKENRTYDQVLGDLPQGNGDPDLCIFGREVTPNHHALAEQFVLLDNFYCNGVNSADGHSWATEGYVTDHLEKSFGGFTRSYTWGDDPLNYSSAGFIWDNVLLHGLSFRNYGEMDYAEPVDSKATWLSMYRDFTERGVITPCNQSIGIETLRTYSSRDFPGWNMSIPEVMRAEVFLRELKESEEKGEWYDFTMIFLGVDHTSGTTPGYPTPRAQVADNDLALGRVIEGITHSRFWPKTCIFVIEDDPQDGFDHVDGHRSLCFVISPYTKRGAVVNEFYNQTSVLHTMERILGLPPMNQMDAMSPILFDCFDDTPNFTPYAALENRIPLDEMNPQVSELPEKERYWAEMSIQQPLSELDAADEDIFNRILWHSVKGVDAEYPAEYAGAHGKGLVERNLVLTDGE